MSLFFAQRQMPAAHAISLPPFRFLSSSARARKAVLTDLRCVCSLHRSELQRGRGRGRGETRKEEDSDMAWQITVQAGEWIDAVAIRSDGHDGFVVWNGIGGRACGFCAHLKRFPFWKPLRPHSTTIFVDFCNESDTRIFQGDFPLVFSSPSFIADVREKQSLSPNLERSRREIKAVTAAGRGSRIDDPRDGWIGCGGRGDPSPPRSSVQNFSP